MAALLSNPEFWKSLSSIIWPIVVLIIFFAAKSIIKGMFSKEQISIEVAGMKLNLADATKNIGKDLADLQQKVADIERFGSQYQRAQHPVDISTLPTIEDRPVSIIWVDDFPSNNAFLVDRLQKDGISVELSLSTSDALSKIRNRSYNLVISDLGRKEDGQNKSMAGLDLIKSLRGSGNNVPIVIYAGPRGLENRDMLMKAGANIITASGSEVVRFVKDIQAGTDGKN